MLMHILYYCYQLNKIFTPITCRKAWRRVSGFLTLLQALLLRFFLLGRPKISQRRFDEGLHRLYHAASTAQICGHWSLWSRIMSHIAAYFLCNDQRDKAFAVMQYKKAICELKKIECQHLSFLGKLNMFDFIV